MGSGFDKPIYMGFHLAELQLFVTQHKLETLLSLSCVLAPGFFLVIASPVVFCLSAVSLSSALDCPLDESSLAGGFLLHSSSNVLVLYWSFFGTVLSRPVIPLR
jgi:hypothetical protein